MDICVDCKHYEFAGCPAEMDGNDSHLCHSPKLTSPNYVTGGTPPKNCKDIRYGPTCPGYEVA